jgi:hypothetical protein
VKVKEVQASSVGSVGLVVDKYLFSDHNYE